MSISTWKIPRDSWIIRHNRIRNWTGYMAINYNVIVRVTHHRKKFQECLKLSKSIYLCLKIFNWNYYDTFCQTDKRMRNPLHKFIDPCVRITNSSIKFQILKKPNHYIYIKKFLCNTKLWINFHNLLDAYEARVWKKIVCQRVIKNYSSSQNCPRAKMVKLNEIKLKATVFRHLQY